MSGSTILFIHPGRAALPEIAAYRDFLHQEFGWQCKEWCITEETFPDWSGVGIAWVFMGLAPKIPKGIMVIHEYASLSTGRFAKWKDLWKRIITPCPDLRIFLNPWVQAQMGFLDRTPSLYRDMGVWDGFYLSDGNRLSDGQDWLYAGSVNSNRGLDQFLDHWCKMNTRPILHLVGTPEIKLLHRFENESKIIFHGHCSREEIRDIASACGFGLNLVPDVHPYSKQTCTKVLEYCAMGLRVVSNVTPWVQAFENARNMRFYHLGKAEINLEEIANFNFRISSVYDLRWDQVMRRSELSPQIRSLIGCKI